jgi:hypothetical protein
MNVDFPDSPVPIKTEEQKCYLKAILLSKSRVCMKERKTSIISSTMNKPIDYMY